MDEWPQFVLLKQIYITNQCNVAFLVQSLSTLTFDHHFHAYIIHKTDLNFVISPEQLHSPFPLHLHSFHDGHNNILLGIVLKYHIANCLL